MKRENKTKHLFIVIFLLVLLCPVVSQALTVNYAYDALGRIETTTYDNGIRIQYTYDALGQRTRKVVTIPENLDSDGDGISDVNDACPFGPNDNIGDPCNHDEDHDGVSDADDAFPNDPNESVDNDGDHIGDNADTDDDNDGVNDDVDRCASTPAGEMADANGCSFGQTPCGALVDVRGHEYETEICGLVNAGYWPLQVGEVEFRPDELVTLKQEVDAIVGAAGFMEDALAFQGGVCANDRVVSYAVNRRIIKANSCPSLGAHRSLAAVIVEVGRAKIKQGQEGWIRFSNLSQGYNGPDYGNTASPYGIANTYFNVAYMLDALIDFDEDQNPLDSSYGRQHVTKAEAASVIYHMLEVDEQGRQIDVPEHVVYLQHAKRDAGFPKGYDVDSPMGRGDVVGLGMRLMRLEGCLEYEDVMMNPFLDVPDDYEYLSDLSAAVGLGVLRNGEGDFTGLPGTWKAGPHYLTDRRGGAILLYRILREAVRGGQCPAKQDCWTVYSENRDLVHFQEQDWLANQLPVQATCAYVLEGLPLATVDANGLINTDFAGVAEAEETLVTIYRMLQVEP